MEPAPDPLAQQLYQVYAGWSAKLHTWVETQLGRHIDCEFVPHTWEFKIYSGHAETSILGAGIPRFTRPEVERMEIILLPRPEQRPDQEGLDLAFRTLCLAAARVLGLKPSKALAEASQAAPEPVKLLRDSEHAKTPRPRRTSTRRRKS